MDIALYLRVLWRFRVIFACGLVIALGLAILSVVRLSFSGTGPTLVYRQSPLYASDVTLQVTTKGFPSGRVPTPQSTDQSQFPGFAITYAQYVTSDAVLRLISPTRKLRGAIKANALVDANSGSTLPFVLIRGLMTTRLGAMELAERTGRALQLYVQQQQVANRIPPGGRTALLFVNHAQPPVLLAGRSKTRPLFIFLAVMVATMGLAFLLENMRPRIHPVADEDEDGTSVQSQSRLSA